jgi:polyhydroxybutyrate depolymerase
MITKTLKAGGLLIFCLGVAIAAAQTTAPGAAAPGSRLLERTLTVGDRQRNFLLYVPASVAPGRPLLMVLHGSYGTPSGMRGGPASAFEHLADQEGFVIAYPEGFNMSWHDCRKETVSPARAAKVDDVAFLRAVARDAVGQFGIDAAKLYLFGFSAGGHMAYRLAWEAPGEVAAIAAVGANLPPPEMLDCVQPARLPRVMLVNGMADKTSPYAGGHHMAGGAVLSAPDSARALAAAHGFSEAGTEEAVSSTNAVRLLTWKRGSVPMVSLYTIVKGEHAVPYPFSGMDAPIEAWKFFTAQ